MIKIYGMPSCPDCAFIHNQITNKENKYEFIDIGSNVIKLKEFLKLRDNNPIFDNAKANGQIGIPCFLFEDGTISLDAKEAHLISQTEKDEAASCSITDHITGKKGC